MDDYRAFSLSEVPNSPAPAREKKEVDEFVGATEFGFNVYTADPGEDIPWGYHRHPNHEELFFVVGGTLAIETPERTYTVGADEGFYVPRGHLNRAHVVGDEPVRVVAVGAPKSSDEATIEERCSACASLTGRTHEVVSEGETEWHVLSCADCGAETRRFS